MSYFVGEDGKKYFPFGRGGRENLLKGCSVLQQHNSVSSSLSETTSGCGSREPHQHTDACGSASSAPNKLVNESFQRLQECPLHVLPIYTRDSDSREESGGASSPDSTLPICITDPDSQPARVYAALAKDVVLEVFKNQVSALLVSRTLAYSSVS